MDDVHFDQVKHGSVAHSADWPYSSFRHRAARGLYPANWSMGGTDPADVGERR
jgi:hypothetical protein